MDLCLVWRLDGYRDYNKPGMVTQDEFSIVSFVAWSAVFSRRNGLICRD